jgi:DNA-binding CsgD family transcriptional regulator
MDALPAPSPWRASSGLEHREDSGDGENDAVGDGAVVERTRSGSTGERVVGDGADHDEIGGDDRDVDAELGHDPPVPDHSPSGADAQQHTGCERGESHRDRDPERVADGVVQGAGERGIQVMTHVAAGLSNDEIAERLYISRATAKTHVSRTMIKLGARDRAQLVVYAYETGLVRPGWTSD